MVNTVLGHIMFPNKFLGHLLIVNMVENQLKQFISFHAYFEIIKSKEVQIVLVLVHVTIHFQHTKRAHYGQTDLNTKFGDK